MLEKAFDDVKQNCSPTDFVHAIYNAGIERPANAASELINECFGTHLSPLNPAVEPSKQTVATRFGHLCGFGLDLALLVGCVDSPVNSVLKVNGADICVAGADATAGAAADAARLGTAGAIYGGIFQNNSEDKNFWRGRAKNALVMGGSLAAIGATSASFATRLADLGGTGKLAASFVGGTIGGVTSSALDCAFNGHKINPADVLWQAAKMGMAAPLFTLGGTIVERLPAPEFENSSFQFGGTSAGFPEENSIKSPDYADFTERKI